MKLTGAITVICSSLLLLMACKKAEDEQPMSAKKQALVNGKWQMFAASATTTIMGQDTTLDMYSQMDECDKDDFMQFAANGTATNDENTNKCPDDHQVEHATWALLDDDTRLALIDNNPDTFDLEITATEMKLKWSYLNTSGEQVANEAKFKNIK